MNNAQKSIRVVLADQHTLVRAGVRALLEKFPGVEVVGEASDGREVLKLVKTHRPNLVLMAIAMPGLNGLEATARIARDFPDVRVIILSMYRNGELCWQALKAGATGYILKKAAVAELETALHRVIRGGIYLCREITALLLKKYPVQGIIGRKSPSELLTGRQREVLQLIAEGQNTKQIGAILEVSPKTVEYHRMRLMNGLNVHDIPGLVRYALRFGIISEEGLATH